MCGRYSITMPPEAMRELFEYSEQPNFPPRYNIAPTQAVPVVRFDNGARHFVLVRWGLVPSWAKEISPSSPMINARSETVFEKPSFRSAVRRRRCLFPVDAFYEWHRSGSRKQPFLIRRADARPFAMGGIWEHWIGADGSELESAAIITTAANATLAPIHHRMPVIIERSNFERWLTTPETDAESLSSLMGPASEDLLEAFEISDRVNKVANDDAGIQDPCQAMGVDAPSDQHAVQDDPQMKLI